MDKKEYAYRLDIATREIQLLESCRPSCKSCDHWRAVVCGVYQEAPPPHIQEEGCDNWVWNDIPF